MQWKKSLQVLSKLKSRKKKSKVDVLIAFDKGIASALGAELAMLFSHAGFSVKTILLDGAQDYISPVLLKEITGHSSWTDDHKPGWLKADIEYQTAVIIEPSKEFQVQLFSCVNEQESCVNQSVYAKYILKHCKMLKILQKCDIIDNSTNTDVNKQFIAIPDNNLMLRSVFEEILSEAVSLAAAKSLDGQIAYYFSGNIENIEYVQELRKAFTDAGITETDAKSSEEQAKIIISKEDKTLEIIIEGIAENMPATANLIFINKHKNGLILKDSIETRLLPQFSCQSCYSRLVSYLKICLSKENI